MKAQKINRLSNFYFAFRKNAFYVIHVVSLGFIFTDVTQTDVIMLFSFYFVSMFSIVSGYHRYFSHRAFKTSRVFQFILAFFAQATAQKGVLWWAAHHREHHKNSDTKNDIHSPRHKGFWYSHMLWVLDPKHNKTNYDLIKDFAKYPELRFLNKYALIPPWIIAVLFAYIGGASMLFFSFFFGLVVIWHATFTINSLSHVYGNQRYKTSDDSKNNWLLALITFGEGWHNNHHHYMHSTRQGFFWWEYDLAYYILKVLSWFGIVWGIREVPDHKKYSNFINENEEAPVENVSLSLNSSP